VTPIKKPQRDISDPFPRGHVEKCLNCWVPSEIMTSLHQFWNDTLDFMIVLPKICACQVTPQSFCPEEWDIVSSTWDSETVRDIVSKVRDNVSYCLTLSQSVSYCLKNVRHCLNFSSL
jgi:hypothetical protein